MFPLFDCNQELVAWISPGKNIFDTDMNWVAYIHNGHIWSSGTGNWIGPITDSLVCLDTNGRVVAWNNPNKVEGIPKPPRPPRTPRSPRPPRPARPARPSRPARPPRPSRGWSSLSFDEWLQQ